MDTFCRFGVALIALLGLATTKVNGQGISQADHEAVSREVLAEADAFLAANRDRDTARVAAHLNDPFIYVSNARQWTSIEEFRPVLEFVARLRRQDSKWIQTQVIPLTRDAALFHGSFTTVQFLPDGGTRSIPIAYFTALYRRIDGRWKMAVVHNSYVVE